MAPNPAIFNWFQVEGPPRHQQSIRKVDRIFYNRNLLCFYCYQSNFPEESMEAHLYLSYNCSRTGRICRTGLGENYYLVLSGYFDSYWYPFQLWAFVHLLKFPFRILQLSQNTPLCNHGCGHFPSALSEKNIAWVNYWSYYFFSPFQRLVCDEAFFYNSQQKQPINVFEILSLHYPLRSDQPDKQLGSQFRITLHSNNRDSDLSTDIYIREEKKFEAQIKRLYLLGQQS